MDRVRYTMVNLRTVLDFKLSSLLCLVLLECVVAQTQTESPTKFSDRVALLSLRSSLGLRSKDWPIKGDPCTVWKGIRCNNNGSVVGINVSGFKRTRTGKQNPKFAVDPLLNLTQLVSFNASRVSLLGPIPDWFGIRLRTLQVLDLSSCSVTGLIPASLGNLTRLMALNLSGNRLTGSVPISLGQLTDLSELDLSRNSLTGLLPLLFGSLQNLSHLDVSSNYLTGSIPPEVGMLSKLVYLNFSNNSFSNSIPPQLGNLTNLVELDLSFNALSGSMPEDLRRMRNLQKMVFSGNLLSGNLPANLFDADSRLHILALRINAFTGHIPETYWSLPELRVLDLSRNNFTGMLPNSSLDPNLAADTELDISQNAFYGGLTPVLRRFKTMDLSQNYFEGRVPDYVLNTNASLSGNCLRVEKAQKMLSECASFYTARGLVFDDFGSPNSTESPAEKSSSGLSRRTVVILCAVAGGVGLILIFLVLPILVAICIRKRGGPTQRGNGVGPSPAAEDAPQPRAGGGRALDLSSLGNAYTYDQLVQATEDFKEANLIKRGHSGDFFHGFLENRIPIVVKRIDLRESKHEGYISELEFFSKTAGWHQRLVPLLGYCLENESQKFLVYKHMRNRDLTSSLYRKSDDHDDGLQSLDWITRLKIALGTAEGLSYLHHECSPPLVHRDVQASSILLDDKFEVRLGSLSEACAQGDAQPSGISRFLRLPQSSDPGSSGTGSGSVAATATCSNDVYCFGKVLMELVTGKLGISSPENDAHTREFLEETLPYISMNEKELVNKILDPSLMVDDDLLEEVWAMAIIAKSCLNPKPSRRPLMRHIQKALENPLRVVREDHSGSSRLRANSSRGSWTPAIFGSWRQSSSDATTAVQSSRGEGGTTSFGGGLKKSGSQGSGPNDNSSSRRRHSNEIFPEPSYIEDV
ncbi:PREDICTED: probable LRR receptor-like serine/threonine-protein kinase At2g16250 [Tarenaya hassleriana]|uniref:probable LRR receptor-like serine/threonine-protein kinase At2g16250 n=1 Tax=Tarenaya hassleriana TaxID=28532 RepID=UPI00053C7AAE|nr:PREDICTED: probable LRR receptor-like serine/threonine-protein kinase At2g16250 [Tarenaya hassleriana]